jgi:RNA:NAD 2'-phosphotransferase (TPT1/KptA family)
VTPGLVLAPNTHVVLEVDAAGMRRDGHQFAASANGVWLTQSVPMRFLRALADDQ